MVKVQEKHDANPAGSAKFGRTCSRNVRRSRSVGGYFNRLPCEILHNIALMLPFSSIMQLRRSSKFWYNLLTDQKFVDLHLTHALQKPPGYFCTGAPNQVCYFVEQSGGHLSTSKIFEYSFDDFEREMWSRFQSSGGLMCAYWSQSYCFRIFNPHIGKEVQVHHDPKFKRWRFLRFFFGYSPSIKEYKILKLGESMEPGQKSIYDRRPSVAEICTLGSNSWREIQNVPTWNMEGYIQCQGNPFWMKESDLHFFDLVSEKFHVIPGPPELDRIHVTHDHHYRYNFKSGLVNMGHTVGHVYNNRLWVLEDKTKGIWINRYDFSTPLLYGNAKLIGTSENGHLFGYIGHLTSFFSHDIGCKGFKVVEMNSNEHGSEEQSSKVDLLGDYIAPHVTSLVSPVSIMKMGKRLNNKRKRVIEALKLDYDATDDDLVNKMYEFLQAYEKDDKAKTRYEAARYCNSGKFRKF